MIGFCRVLIFGVCVFFIFGCSPSFVHENLQEQKEHIAKQNRTEKLSQTEVISLQEVHWKVVGMHGKAVRQNVNQRAPYLLLTIENTQVQGFSGCNRLTGMYTLKEKEQIRFSKMASTRMACLDSTVEGEFLQALEAVQRYRIARGVLILEGSKNEDLITFEVSQED